MTPGQRIALITESGRLLAVRAWPELDLVLRQFDLPIDNETRYDDKYVYVLEMIGYAPDDKLQGLHSYLVGESDDVPVDSEPWAQGQLKLFMSHLAIHQEYVGQVGTYLSPYGVSAFVAHTSIEPSKEWEDVVEAALRTCDAMVVFLHRGFHESKWCDQEVGFGLARRVPTLLIKINEMPYGFMSKYQALNGRERNPFQLATSITDWLVAAPTAQSAMTEGLVTALERSSSYDGTRRIMTLLRQIPRFTPQQLERLWEAAQNNGQVSDANLKVDRDYTPVPWLIKELIVQHGGRVPAAIASEEPPW